jgi:HAD superfamily hydrolase (TIGR01509 family)
MFLFFDIGFTLVGGPSVGPSRRLLDALGLPPQAKEPMSQLLFAQPYDDAAQLADQIVDCFHTPPALTRASVDQLWRAQIEEAELLPGAAALLQQVRQEQIPFAFISNIWSPFYAGFARLLPDESAHYPGFYSFQQRCAKPDPELYQRALQQCGVAAEQAIMIGDTYAMDVAPARQVGMKTVWVLHRPQQEKRELLAIVNGTIPAPDWTAATIAEVTLRRLHNLVSQEKKG